MKISRIQQQVKQSNRYSIYIDDKFAFGMSEDSLLASGIYVGLELTTNERKTLEEGAAQDKIYGAALRYIALRPRSTYELRLYLKRKKAEEPAIEQIIERLARIDLLNDEKFAELWVANRRLLKAVSKRRLRQELQVKQIRSDIIDRVLQEEDEDVDRQALLQLIEKKRSRYPSEEKLMQYLARQGFPYDDIKSALTTLPEY